MPIRKPTLEEWFLIYQLKKAGPSHFHLPFTLEADVTRIAASFSQTGKSVPWTSVLVKAAGILLEQYPVMNRAVFSTIFGIRFLEPDKIAVNMPIMIRDGERGHLVAMSIQEPHLKTLQQIREEIQKSAGRKIEETLIGKYVFNKPNHFFNRFRLKIIYFMSANFPKLHQKFGAGGICVSSLLNVHDGVTDMNIQAYGHTGFTVGASSVVKRDGKTILRLGMAYDHLAFFGEEAVRGTNVFAAILRGDDESVLRRLVT
jgi:hypothetical protein